jgi:hypothetical protein
VLDDVAFAAAVPGVVGQRAALSAAWVAFFCSGGALVGKLAAGSRTGRFSVMWRRAKAA